MSYVFSGMSTQDAAAARTGAPDAYGNPPEHGISSGSGVQCRHCLKIVPEGEAFLVFAFRPFETLHPYAETGPVFICQNDCEAPLKIEVPEVLTVSPEYLIKGYTADERIKYGTGAIVPLAKTADRLDELLSDADLSFIDIRSAKNNCWLTRMTRTT
jgi:hypothetical protein